MGEIKRAIIAPLKGICRLLKPKAATVPKVVARNVADKPIIKLGVTPFLLAEILKISILSLLAKNILKLRKFI